MGIAFAVLALGLGGIVGWLVARRGADASLREVELELAAARASLAAKSAALSGQEQVAGLLATTRAEFARVDAEARMARQQVNDLQREVEALRGVEARAARLESELAAAQRGAARADELEAALADSSELNARREAELRAAMERREALESQVALLEDTRARAAALGESLARAEASLAAVADSDKTRAAMKLEFESLSKKLLDEKLQQSEKGLEGLLTPVREKLKTFEEKVQQTFDQDNRDRATLFAHLKGLAEAQSRLHADAQALSKALSGENRAQGDWGELVLESLLSSAGLTEGREYELQVDSVGEDGRRRRPDALVYLPGNRVIIVDSKCSLQAFIASGKAQSDEEREDDLAAHVHSLRTHVKLLSAKEYRLVTKARTVDFVFLFVPNEAAFHAALSRAPELPEEALRQNVVIVSPTTLLTTLQMVHHVWRSERQTENALVIAEEAGKMVDKLSASLTSLDMVGARLRQAGDAFDDAKRRMGGKGSALSLARKVKELGARVGKVERLEEVERAFDAEVPRAREVGDGRGEAKKSQTELLLDSGGDQPC